MIKYILLGLAIVTISATGSVMFDMSAHAQTATPTTTVTMTPTPTSTTMTVTPTPTTSVPKAAPATGRAM